MFCLEGCNQSRQLNTQTRCLLCWYAQRWRNLAENPHWKINNASTWGGNLATSPAGSYTLRDLLHQETSIWLAWHRKVGRGSHVEPKLPDLPPGTWLQNGIFVTSWGLVGGQFVPHRAGTLCSSCWAPWSYGAWQHPATPELLSLSQLCGKGSTSRVGLWTPKAAFRTGDNVNRSGKGFAGKHHPPFRWLWIHQHG